MKKNIRYSVAIIALEVFLLTVIPALAEGELYEPPAVNITDSGIESESFNSSMTPAFEGLAAYTEQNTGENGAPGWDVKEISTLDEMVNVSSGAKDSQMYNIKGTSIYVIAIDSMPIWEETFERLGYFVEGVPNGADNPVGAGGSIVTNEEALNKDLYDYAGGADFSMSDIAAFYNLAAEKEKAGMITLLPYEKQLREDLKNLGLIEQKDGRYRNTGDSAVITMDRYMRDIWGDAAYREGFLHEFNHGLYFTDSRFREACTAEWNSLSEDEKNRVKERFKNENTNDESLMAREYAAYSCTDWDTLADEDFNVERARRLKSLFQEYEKNLLPKTRPKL